MALSMFSASAPVLARMLERMLRWLDKAQAHAEARGFNVNNYLGLRLAPDMLPLSAQVQIASDMAKSCMARLTGQDVPQWADDEATLDDLRARVRKTLDYVSGFKAEQFGESDLREIVIRQRTGQLQFTGEDYLTQYVLPNFYFHATTLYALLRHAGVELGKRDFLG